MAYFYRGELAEVSKPQITLITPRFLSSQVPKHWNVACLNERRIRGRRRLTHSRQYTRIHSWLLVGKLCLAWRGTGGGEWSLFESLCQIFVLFLEWDRAPTSRRQPRQPAHERRVGSRAAWNQSCCKKGAAWWGYDMWQSPPGISRQLSFPRHSLFSPASATGKNPDQPAHTPRIIQ